MNEPYLNIPIAGFRADCCIQRIKAFPTDSFSFTLIEEGVDLKKKEKKQLIQTAQLHWP